MSQFNHTLVQQLYNDGRIYDGTVVARRYIQEHGKQNSQLEILLLAKGLYAIGDLPAAHVWICQTNADPVIRIELQEKIERKLGLIND